VPDAATIDSLCRRIARALRARDQKVVLAESCTGGLVAASLARVPGISQYLCGSAVTYREETKAAWLQIPRATIASAGAVSEVIAIQLARRVLAITPEAQLAMSVTGHLGPNAPAELDGVIYIGSAVRKGQRAAACARKFHLEATMRVARQREAARRVLLVLAETLDAIPVHGATSASRRPPVSPAARNRGTRRR
jgi:PncC family amidohydrolase